MKPDRIIIIICAIAAFAAIAVISDRVFEHVPHSEDEVAYLFQAKVFAQNRLAVPTPPHKDAFWSPFVLDYRGWRFGKYPPGWPLLLSLGVRLNQPWLVNALLGTLTLALISGLGYLFYGDPPEKSPCCLPPLAAGLGLLTPGFLLLSSSLLSHAASLFWSTLALLALFKIGNSSRSYALLTGLCLGAAFVTRPFAGVGIGLALGIFLLTLLLRGQLQWTLLIWVAAGGLAVAALLPLYWWTITGNPAFNAYLLVWPYDRVGFGPEIGPLGYTLRDAIFINTQLKLVALGTGLFGWPGWTNLMFLPIPFVARQANRWDWLLLGTILSLIFVHIFYWAFGGVDGGFPRYYYDALPALLLLTARGIQILYGYLRPTKLGLRWLLVAGLVILVGYNLGWNLPPLLAAQKGKYGITPAPLQLVEQANLPQPALILAQNVDIWSDFAAPFAANSPTLDGPVVYAIDWGGELTRQVREQFSNRSCWQLRGDTLQPCPPLK